MELRLYRFPEWQETEYKCILLKRNTSYNTDERAEPVPSDTRLPESLSRSRRIIMETILCNQFDLFCTFTFDQHKVADRTDYSALKKKFSKALNNYKNRYDKNFKYLYIPELHKDGAVHFHGVMTFPRGAPDGKGMCCPLEIQFNDLKGILRTIPNRKGYMNWPYYSDRFGFFSCSWIRNYTGCAIYVSKYMTKDLANWFAKGDQIVMKSKNLIKPELVYVDNENGIPGGIQAEDYNDEWCAVAMRNALQVSEIYFNPDDSWSRYTEVLEDLPQTNQNMVLEEITNPLDKLYPGDWKKLPGAVDDWEQVSMLYAGGFEP